MPWQAASSGIFPSFEGFKFVKVCTNSVTLPPLILPIAFPDILVINETPERIPSIFGSTINNRVFGEEP